MANRFDLIMFDENDTLTDSTVAVARAIQACCDSVGELRQWQQANG
jgi:hypothetical protein